MKVVQITAHEILASGGYPTIEAEVTLDSGVVGTASVPYGVSAGSHEATVLVDGDTSRYQGNGMLRAIENVTQQIAPALIGKDASDQSVIDKTMIELDGTPQKSKLGGNAILAVSVAMARAAAAEKKQPLYTHLSETFSTGVDYLQLPKPMVVVIEGGKHADNTTDLQEYCITGIGEGSSTESIRKCLESYHSLAKVLKQNNLSTNVGNEGAFAPNGIVSNEAPFEFILQAIDQAGYLAGKDLGISIDAAANEFYKDGKYHLAIENKSLSATELISYYENWLKKYPIATVEDLLAEDDWDNWVELKKMVDTYKLPLIGDDLTVTNMERLQKAIELNAISAILIKLNQIGTVSETINCCMLAKQHGMMTVLSHRGGGETNDTAMVDVAVAVGSTYIKVGPTRGERVSKYNRLMEIERELRS
ncbi:MAG: phosphopyruvate hydratase [Patescibacteria group bacterium]